MIRDALPTLPNGTVDEFMRVLFRERSWGEMAESETFAHLEHLRELGELARHVRGRHRPLHARRLVTRLIAEHRSGAELFGARDHADTGEVRSVPVRPTEGMDAR